MGMAFGGMELKLLVSREKMESEIYEVHNGRINITLPPNSAVILRNIGKL